MGNDESHFNGSLIVRDKVTRQCRETIIFEGKGEPKRIRTEVPLLTSLSARPNRLRTHAPVVGSHRNGEWRVIFRSGKPLVLPTLQRLMSKLNGQRMTIVYGPIQCCTCPGKTTTTKQTTTKQKQNKNSLSSVFEVVVADVSDLVTLPSRRFLVSSLPYVYYDV